MMGRRYFLLFGFLTVSALCLMGVAIAESPDQQVSDAIEKTESVDSTAETATETYWHAAAGGAVGLGIGLFVGSSAAYQYWRREMQ